MSESVSVPSDLPQDGRGRRFWDRVTAEHVLRPDEVELLCEAARMLELADRLREVVDDDGPLTSGSRGQLTTHPALTELRLLRQELRHHLRELDLPEPEPEHEQGGKLRAVQ